MDDLDWEQTRIPYLKLTVATHKINYLEILLGNLLSNCLSNPFSNCLGNLVSLTLMLVKVLEYID